MLRFTTNSDGTVTDNNSGTTYDPAVDSLPPEFTSTDTPLNSITGTLGKAADTFLDVLAIGSANKIVGTTYPTGSTNPQQVKSGQTTVAVSAPFNWKPWAIGGAIVFAAILGGIVLIKAAKKA